MRGVSYFETMKRRKKKQENITGIRFQEKLLNETFCQKIGRLTEEMKQK